ncbi:hypothetical protein DMB41_20630 [Pectobacterium carotovorum subsp. carotovorum]|nr:hypothetical protein DMB41_20630 [Pectobacterium carotovorum subsp. carotovorum]
MRHHKRVARALLYTRHTSSCLCVGCPYSPQSLTCVSFWGFMRLPPSCNSNYLGYIFNYFATSFRSTGMTA